MNVFAYGTLAHEDRQKILCGRTFPMKAATLLDYRLDEEPGCYRMIYPQIGGRIDGTLVMDLNEDELVAFDEWEDEGRLYKRVKATVLVDGEQVEAWAYEGMGRKAKI